ncbi:phage tail protein [Dialister invisus]|uniref:phage tail protein n=1 Tax=Dialister invisus TaxID=218538 RepID=UPI00266F953D|nr:phage tail protein [Dialister invisus]
MSFFRGRTTTTRANKISEFTVNTAEYGAVVPEIIGTVRTAGNVIYYDDFTAHEHRETHKAGKGGKSKQVSITYTYTVAVILGLCEGPISGIGKVWIGKNVHNYPADDIQLTLFDGKENQQPWAYTQGKHPDKALPYPGLAYMAGVIDLGDSGSMPSYNFEVKGRLLETGDGIDVNPADYIRYVLDKIGKKDMQIIGLDNYRKYCKEADLLISSPPDEDAKAAREVVNEIAKLTNAYVFWSNDKLKIVPLADRPVGRWAPDKTGITDLTADDFLPQTGGALVTYKRKDSSAIYNQFPVEFINRANGYEKESVSYEFTEDIKNYGVRAASVTNAHYVYTKERAVKIAEQLARNNKYERTQYTFKLDWSLCRLEVGDLVRLTDENSGIFEQVAVINGITEGTDGCLTVTAISRAPGDYPAAKYNVHANDRPYIDYNKTAPDTIPVIFQPPADLTADGLELWIAAKGKADGWGGCVVYVSDDNTNYRTVGQIAGSARCGKLMHPLSPMPNHPSGNQAVVTCNDQLLSGTLQDAEHKNTLCWIDGECMSYMTATLQVSGAWLLSGLIRGQCNTAVRMHAKDTDFIRLDNSVFKVPFSKDDIGKKIYLKFCSYNIFGAGQQDLSEVKAYEYTLTPYYIPPVTNITAHNRYRQLADGVSRYDIVVNWTPPELQSYLQGDVWYKTSNGQAKDLVIKEGTKGSELGFDGEWTFGGSGKDQVVIPQAIVGDTYLIAVCTKDEWGEVTSPDTSPQIKILVALKTEIPNTPDGFEVNFGAACTASWKEVTNTDVAFYEIRTDQSPGAETSRLLVRTNNLSAILPLTERSGKLYLYAKSAIGKYSTPAILQYNKPIPKKPNPPVLTSTIGGFGLTAEAIPNDCAGMNIYINGTDGQKAIKTENNSYSHTCGAGIYDVSIAYYDLFGEGEKSGESRVVVKISISKEMLEDATVSIAKVDALVKQKLNDGEIAKQNVATVVSNLGNLMLAKANYSAIAQMTDAINLRVQKGDVINQINLSPTTTTIAGKYLHVTGETVFDNNVIVSRMLAAKAITADKLAVTSLSAITANIGLLRTKTSGARTEIKDNLIEVYDSNNMLRVRMGVW